MNNQFESTYALLVRSEEKGRGVLEILVYAIFLLGVVFSILQFAQSPIKIPSAGIEHRVVCGPTVPQAAL
jgi:signal peptidase I